MSSSSEGLRDERRICRIGWTILACGSPTSHMRPLAMDDALPLLIALSAGATAMMLDGETEVHDDRCPWGLVGSGRQAGQRAPGDLSGEGVEVCRVVISCGELSELRGENDQTETRRNAGTWQHPGAVGPRCIPDAV